MTGPEEASRTGRVTDVVAALIWEGGRFLICRRPPHKARGGLWEFVGGKVEPGETKEQALIRECREELGITVRPMDEFMTVLHAYPDLTVRLMLLNARIGEGTPKLLEHTELAWITPEEADAYAFCPADTEILRALKEKKGTRTAEEGSPVWMRLQTRGERGERNRDHDV